MAIRSFVWACITCGREGTLRAEKKTEVCNECGTTYQRARGASISVRPRGGEARTYPAAEIADLLPDPGTSGVARCQVQEWVRDKRLHALGAYLGRIDTYGESRIGTLTLREGRLSFRAGGRDLFDLPVLDITAIQPGSRAIQIKTATRLFSLKFVDSSAMLWEDRLHAALIAAYERAEAGTIVEFLPRVCTQQQQHEGTRAARVRRRVQAARMLRPPAPWQYRLCSWIARTIWKRFGGGLIVEGLEHIPQTGPFLVLVNHQSYLEPMLVPAVVSRPMHAMAKTTQFTVPFFGWLMAQVFAFPVRRFEVDPHAVRYGVKRLAQGYGLMIFPEGERSWDGRLQPLRFGVMRLAQNVGATVIPCRVSGAYQAWPRWSSKPQRHPIRIAFGKPLTLPDRIDDVVNVIREAIDPGAQPGQTIAEG